jgi:hypothetical protein
MTGPKIEGAEGLLKTISYCVDAEIIADVIPDLLRRVARFDMKDVGGRRMTASKY